MRTYSGIAVPEKLFASFADRVIDSAGIDTGIGRLFIHPRKARIPMNVQRRMIMILTDT